MTDMHTYLVEEELERYQLGYMSRRQFIHRLGLLGVGTAAAVAMAATIVPRTMMAAPPAQLSPFHVPENDASVSTERITYASADGVQIGAYLAWGAEAASDRSRPGVVVVHENSGLIPHIEDVARRFAKLGYVALAPDLITRIGPPRGQLTDDEGRRAFGALDPNLQGSDLVAALDLLAAHPSVDDTRLAATGYCAGGGNVWRLATLSPRLRAAAPFYGSSPAIDRVPNIRAAMLGVYASEDARINAGISDLEGALQRAGVVHRMKIYPASVHGFFRDTTPETHNAATATEAWQDTLAWFSEHLALSS